MSRPDPIRIGDMSADGPAIDSLISRIALVRAMLVDVRQVASNSLMLETASADQSINVNAIRDAKSSRVVFYGRGLRDGRRHDVRLCLSRKPADGIREEMETDPAGAVRYLDLFEDVARRREAFMDKADVPYHKPDETGLRYARSVEDVVIVASALIRAVNARAIGHHHLRITAPCLGTPGRIVDHKSRRPFPAALERRLLRDVPDCVMVRHHAASDYSLEPHTTSLATIRTDAIATMRILASSGFDVMPDLNTAAMAID